MAIPESNTVSITATGCTLMNTRNLTSCCLAVFFCCSWIVVAVAAEDVAVPNKAALATQVAPAPKPTIKDLSYGTHARHVLDFYQAESGKPTPLVFYIHGGAWMGGDKSKVLRPENGLRVYLAAGISVAAINYRYVSLAQAAGVEPPVKWPLEDAARALQFVRTKAKEWNFDPERIGAAGVSSGGASALWLCCHDDLAQPQSEDPVARQSTRLFCGAPVAAQTCFDPQLLREWLPSMDYGGHAFGFYKPGQSREAEFQAFYEARAKVMPWVREYSAYHLVTTGDPPVFLQYSNRGGKPPIVGQPIPDSEHSAVLGVKLAEKLTEAGVENYLSYPGGPENPWPNAVEFLIARLKGASTQ